MADMKVDGVGSGRGTAPTRKTKKVTSGGGTFSDTLKETAETTRPDAASGVGGVSPVSAILAVQEVPDSTEERSKGLLIAYGDDLLDRLEELRVGLLMGAIPKEDLADLAHRMREKKQNVDDPALKEIIDEIELRAEVEIAKLTRGI